MLNYVAKECCICLTNALNYIRPAEPISYTHGFYYCTLVKCVQNMLYKPGISGLAMSTNLCKLALTNVEAYIIISIPVVLP